MSGLEEIRAWALEEFPIKDYDTYQDWFNAVNKDFEGNNRLPLDEILDTEEINSLEETFNKLKEKGTASERITKTLEAFEEPITLKKLSKIMDINYNTLRGRLSEGVKKGLFKRVSKGVYEI